MISNENPFSTSLSASNLTSTPSPSPFSPEALETSFKNFIISAKKLEENHLILKEEIASLKEEIKQKDLEIKRQENLATIGQTASALAHEIRNPLGAMKLFISILKNKINDDASKETIKQIDICISKLDNAVSNILQFAKNKKETFAPVNLESIIKEEILILKNTFKGNLTTQENFDFKLPFILGSQNSLRRVFNNLFLNAIQAQKENVFLGIDAKQTGENIEINIFDHGNGIDETIIDNIFDPFISTKNEGTGLGLSVVKKILNDHNAEISVSNILQDNKILGANFKIIFKR